MRSHGNSKLTRVSTANITKAVFTEIDGVNWYSSTQINFNPTKSGFTDPTCPTAIKAIIDI
jgi:hypothetical protein